eukprot:CAMPEP_0170358186 /NCGR_PEP_ID=MMETSP0117_2-20130122/2096_1 /TAXON_ID=400756 /ORGANISM="Durinskia baltica, Strain CSIRO CS-38" /LENGTH=49 /DNA_ID=CAMNT_0010612383 /DNA_START=318 /DNA_END=467 /DNA_ORIENTATION=+
MCRLASKYRHEVESPHDRAMHLWKLGDCLRANGMGAPHFDRLCTRFAWR